MTVTGERADVGVLIDYGYIDREPPNNAIWYKYGKGSECGHVVRVPIREERLWCPICTTEGVYSQLRRVWESPSMQQVWHEHWNMATGRMESDRKQMEQHGKAHADKISEELGIAHSFERVDWSELRKTAEADLPTSKTDSMAQALVSTHDRAVAEGRKESKGRFVY